MKTLFFSILFIALLMAGCGDKASINSTAIKDGSPSNVFLFEQEYGYCDTVCQAISVVLASYTIPYDKNCYVRYVNTLDTLYMGLPNTNFKIHYSTQNPVSVNFGNGVTKTYNGQGLDSIKYFCNQIYEVIICYEE